MSAKAKIMAEGDAAPSPHRPMRQGLVLTVSRFLGLALNFGFQVLAARFLGAATYGLYALCRSVIEVLHVIAKMGFENTMVRFVAIDLSTHNHAAVKGTIRSAFGIVLVVSVSLAAAVYVMSDWIADGVFKESALGQALRLFALSLPLYALLGLSVSCLRAAKKMVFHALLYDLAFPALNLFIAAAVFLLGFRLFGAVGAFALSCGLTLILALYLMVRVFPQMLRPKIVAMSNFRVIMPYSLIMLLTGLSQILLTYADRLILGLLGKPEEVGVYNAAALLAMQVLFFLATFNTAFAPAIAELHHAGRKEELEKLFKGISRLIFLLTLPFFLTLIHYRYQVMALFGADFAHETAALVVLATAQFIVVSAGGVGWFLNMTGWQKVELLNNWSLVPVNIGLNIVLVPRYGILGAAAATAVCVSLLGVARLIQIFTLFKIHPYSYDYWKPILVGVGLFFIWPSFPSSSSSPLWLVGASAYIFIYFLVVYLSSSNAEDRALLAGMINRMTLTGRSIFGKK